MPLHFDTARTAADVMRKALAPMQTLVATPCTSARLISQERTEDELGLPQTAFIFSKVSSIRSEGTKFLLAALTQ